MSFFNSIIPSLTGAQTDGANGPGLEQSRARSLKPRYEVNETGEAYLVTVYLPGVAKENLEITGENDELRILARRTWQQPAGWTALHRESDDAPYELVLAHANSVNVGQIHAELRDGVLRLSLPKAEAVKPRKIAVG